MSYVAYVAVYSWLKLRIAVFADINTSKYITSCFWLLLHFFLL